MPLDDAAIYEFRLTSTFGYTETRRRPPPPTRGHEQLVAAREAGGVAKPRGRRRRSSRAAQRLAQPPCVCLPGPAWVSGCCGGRAPLWRRPASYTALGRCHGPSPRTGNGGPAGLLSSTLVSATWIPEAPHPKFPRATFQISRRLDELINKQESDARPGADRD